MSVLPLSFALAADVEAVLHQTYGAILLTEATPPPTLYFPDQDTLDAFLQGLDTTEVTLDGQRFSLQSAAANALAEARDEAAAQGITLQFRGTRPAGRTHAESRPAFQRLLTACVDHWSIDSGILSLSLPAQLEAVLAEESEGRMCNKHFNRSILSSAAAPGTSQHHSLLAVDLEPYKNSSAIAILARHGWHRTVWADRPHFTYLGVPDPSALGLVPKLWRDLTFWVPPPPATEETTDPPQIGPVHTISPLE